MTAGSVAGRPAGDVLASVAQRALALALDSVVVLVPVAGAALVGGIDPFDEERGAGPLLTLTVAWFVVSVAYHTVAVALAGRTLGKQIVGLRVVRAADGGPVGWASASLRALVPAAVGLVPWIGLGLQVAVYLRAGFHPLRQGWHDAAAHTLVVRRRAQRVTR